MLKLLVVAASAAVLSTNVFAAQDCSSVIALSRLSRTTLESASDVETHASRFCSDYRSHRGSSNSFDFGASYKFLSANMGSSNASVEDVANKYCSAANDYRASTNAYASYIDSVAPGAFDAYRRCIEMSSQYIHFDVDPAAVLPKQFAMTVSFSAPGAQRATLRATPSDGVTCQWDGSTGSTISIPAPAVATLSCRRNSTPRSFVTITIQNGSNTITIPWQAYTSEGVPVDLVRDLLQKVALLDDRLNRLGVQTGTVHLPETANATCGGDRGVLSGRVRFARPFRVPPQVSMGLSHIDIYNTFNTRIKIVVSSVDANGFDYQFATWCDTHVAGAIANWIAVAR